MPRHINYGWRKEYEEIQHVLTKEWYHSLAESDIIYSCRLKPKTIAELKSCGYIVKERVNKGKITTKITNK